MEKKIEISYLIFTSSKGTTTKLSWKRLEGKRIWCWSIYSSSGTAARQNGQILGHLGLSSETKISFPPEVVRSTWREVSRWMIILEWQTDNLTARLGASSIKGGTRPLSLQPLMQGSWRYLPRYSRPTLGRKYQQTVTMRRAITYPSSRMIFLRVPTNPNFAFPVSSCIRVLTYAYKQF